MSYQIKKNALIPLLLVLIFGLLGAFGYFYHTQNNAISYLEDEKTLLLSELQQKQNTIDSLLHTGRFNKIELEASKEEIGLLIDSIGRLKNKVVRLERFRSNFEKLQEKYAWLRNKNTELYNDNHLLKEKIGDNRSQIANLEATTSEIDKSKAALAAKTKALEEEVLKRSFLNISEVEATAFRLKPNKDISRTIRANATAKLRACFQIQSNPNLANINKTVYLQFVDNTGNVLPDEDKTTLVDGIRCSKKTQLLYNGQNMEVCDFISLAPGQVRKGQYILNIYEGGKLLGTTTFRLK